MHIKTRKGRAILYRSCWIAKGTNGNSHGYSVQKYVASIDVQAQSLSPEIAALLSPAEMALVEQRVLQPARVTAQQRVRALEQHRLDPLWRLEDAARLAGEAAELSAQAAVPLSRIVAIQTQLTKVLTITAVASTASTTGVVPVVAPVAAISPKSDPLREALRVIKEARDAVLAGRYGSAPSEGVRNTSVYRLWAEISETVTGNGDGSLLRALQVRGYAKTRGKSVG
jgi:hypothetical protein